MLPKIITWWNRLHTYLYTIYVAHLHVNNGGYYIYIYIYIGDVYIDIRMKYIYIVTYNHEELYGEIHLFIIVESICMIMEKYLHICWRHIYILVIECWTYSVTTFRGIAKPPTYLLYMRELTHNNGSLYIYILVKNSVYVLRYIYIWGI